MDTISLLVPRTEPKRITTTSPYAWSVTIRGTSLGGRHSPSGINIYPQRFKRRADAKGENGEIANVAEEERSLLGRRAVGEKRAGHAGSLGDLPEARLDAVGPGKNWLQRRPRNAPLRLRVRAWDSDRQRHRMGSAHR